MCYRTYSVCTESKRKVSGNSVLILVTDDTADDRDNESWAANAYITEITCVHVWWAVIIVPPFTCMDVVYCGQITQRLRYIPVFNLIHKTQNKRVSEFKIQKYTHHNVLELLFVCFPVVIYKYDCSLLRTNQNTQMIYVNNKTVNVRSFISKH